MGSIQSPPLRLPADFEWGLGTAAFQVEGATTSGGRGPSIWDEFCRLTPARCAGGATGDQACEHYSRLSEDIATLASLGVPHYRFSIAWSRVIPLGGRNDPLNEEGLVFYDRMIDLLLENNITPWVTLFHWDLPQELQKRYGGFLNQEEIVQDFERYARVIFARYGDRVKRWITFNEPWIISVFGFSTGTYAPGRSSTNPLCSLGESSSEPWIVGKSIIMCHAHATSMYNRTFRTKQKGQISVVLNGDYFEPFDSANLRDVAAACRRMEFHIGWFGDPILLGKDYPESMRKQLGSRLPRFTPSELELLRSTKCDFYGMNYYTAQYARAKDGTPAETDYNGHVEELQLNAFNESIGAESGVSWLRVCPVQFRKLLGWIYQRYHLPIVVTENGCPCPNEDSLSGTEACEDDFRVDYINMHLDSISQAIYGDAIPVRGWIGWSFMDNLGYAIRFGLVHVDYTTQKRTPKRSALGLRRMFDVRTSRMQRENV